MPFLDFFRVEASQSLLLFKRILCFLFGKSENLFYDVTNVAHYKKQNGNHKQWHKEKPQ